MVLLVPLLAVGVALASWISPWLLAAYTAAVASAFLMSALRCVPRLGSEARLLGVVVVAAVAASPFVAIQWGEPGLFSLVGVATILCGTSLVFEGVRPGVVTDLSMAVAFFLYFGLPLAYLALIRAGYGHRALLASGLIVVCYELGKRLVGDRSGGVTGTWERWAPRASGTVACEVGSVISGSFLAPPAATNSLLLLGGAVAVGLVLGEKTHQMIGELPLIKRKGARERAFAPFSILLFALPAFLYSYRVLLT